MRFNLISNSIKRRHNKINTHVMYLIHSSQKTKLYLKQIPNGHDEMATRGRWFLGQYSPKLTSAFDFSSAFVLRYHFVPHFRAFSRKGESGNFLSMSTNVFMGGVIRDLANFESLIDLSSSRIDTICEIRHCFMWADWLGTGNIWTLC